MASIALRWLPIALFFYFSLLTANGRKIMAEDRESLWLQSQIASISSDKTLSHKNLTEGYHAQRLPQKSRFVRYQSYDAPFYGVQALFSVWSFPVGYDQNSMAFITIDSGEGSNINAIRLGWQICPSLYNDYDPHFFISWTADGYNNTGCYNLLCPGFVLSKNSNSIPGTKFWPLSKYGGTQYYGHYKIFKDSKTGDWWIYEGANTYSNPVGYFPQSLFTNLAHNASSIALGGYAFAFKNGITPPMGSGHDSSEGYGKAAKFDGIKFVEKNGESREPTGFHFEDGYVRARCYSGSIMEFANKKGSFYYGGPGNC